MLEDLKCLNSGKTDKCSKCRGFDMECEFYKNKLEPMEKSELNRIYRREISYEDERLGIWY